MYHGIRKVLAIAGLALLSWLGLRFFLPLFLPFLLGGALALAAEPMVAFLAGKGHMRRWAATALGVTALLLFFTWLLALLLALVVRELGQLMVILPDLESAMTGGLSSLSAWALSLISRLPSGIREILEGELEAFFSGSSQLLKRSFGFLLSFTGRVLGKVPDGALIAGTALISAYMISVRLPRLKRWVREKIPLERIRKLQEGFSRLRAGIAGWLKAQLKLMGITWLILTPGLLLLRIPHAPVWATAITLVDAFPILGTGTVLLPWALVSLLGGNKVQALGLASIYVAISLSRSVLEPKLLGSHLGLDPLVTLAALYAGYKLWGFGGLILAPVLAVAAVQLLRPERQG